MVLRPLNEAIPEYLLAYVVQQDASLYTPMDHASWRFILKIARQFFAHNAHQAYLDGLRETGISTERIPLISEMDACLRKFNWRTAAVSGFIPPAVFMEFLARGILPIACDMRKMENLAYTPAPDIVHEAAGHAPIIADPGYAQYLRHYGELAEKAIYSAQDLEVYNAVRVLSDVKEDPLSTDEQVAAAQNRLDRASASVDHDTEATQLGRMGWWTIEYGLIGDEKNPKIYGAGLLSSVGESFHCLKPEVRKVPLTRQCVDQTYDITRPQPQLFVASDFASMTRVLDDFGQTMAYRRGGLEGLEKARRAAVATTAVLDSGIQISGTLTRYAANPQPYYLKFDGPTQLSFADQELVGQGPAHHREGFSTVLGPIRNQNGRSPAELSESELNQLGFADPSRPGRMEFESGVVLEGRLTNRIARGGKNLVLTFQDCRVSHGPETLFDPGWGVFDLACGSQVVSVFGGAADRRKYLAYTGGFKQEPRRQKTNLTPANRTLNELYARVRKLREEAAAGKLEPETLERQLGQVNDELDKNHPEDWLLRYELLELEGSQKLQSPWQAGVRSRLVKLSRKDEGPQSGAELIKRGLELL